MESKDTYLTIDEPSQEVLYKEKNSKFFSYVFPVSTEEDIKKYIDHLQKQHLAARHWCYAYKIGTLTTRYRVNDDGEPNNSAGLPIYGQIQSSGVTNVLVVVVRYFGGVKLGVGGLITAYKTAAQMALEVAPIIEKTIQTHFIIQFDYKNMNKVMRIIKEKHLNIVGQKMDERCQIEIATRKKNAKEIFDVFDRIFEVSINEI